MLPGLHVTLLSLLRALSPEQGTKTKIVLFLDNVPQREQDLLRKTHQTCHKDSLIKIIDHTPRSPTGGDLLHGNATTYGRLSLPRLLPQEPKCVYLDCDLIVNRCVSHIFKHFDDDHILLVDGSGKREYSLDKALFREAGLELSGPCFNAGVMGINLELWREREIDKIIESIAIQYKGMFKSVDQSLLNVALHSSFKSLGNDINTSLYPNSPPCRRLENKIYHFVGSPKPWDFLGSFSSNHFKMWKDFYVDTSISGKSPLRYTTAKRAFAISKQSFKAIKAKVQQ